VDTLVLNYFDMIEAINILPMSYRLNVIQEYKPRVGCMNDVVRLFIDSQNMIELIGGNL